MRESMKRKAKTKTMESKKQKLIQKSPSDSNSSQNPSSNSPMAYYLLVVPPGGAPPTGATPVPGAPPPAAAAAATEAVRRITGSGGIVAQSEPEPESDDQDLDLDREVDPNPKPRGRGRGKGKRFKRHTPFQIQELESFFIQNPHPDDKQREDLSRNLGLEPTQVKFWFQNKRTQIKNQFVWQENTQLRVEIENLKSENEKLKKENKEIKETLASATCPTCGVPSVLGELSSDEQPQNRQMAEQNEVGETRAEDEPFIFAV